jgi:cytochrome c oxidase subunit II
MRTVRLLALLVLAGSACAGPQRILDTQGPGARHIAGLWWLLLGFAIVTSIVIPLLLLWAVRTSRRRARGEQAGEVHGVGLVVAGGVIVPLVLLVVSIVASFRAADATYRPYGSERDPLTIEVIGHQFWWEIRYPQHGITTANEFHIPAGHTVKLLLSAADVIHSFWVPQLHGKMDLVPGRTNEWWIHADSAGVYRGQCAEYCGLSHALMALRVTAVDVVEFAAWVADRTAPRAALAPEREAGRRIFAEAGCGQCHATPDAPLPPRLASVAPDLGDFGARTTIGAGRMPNTAANLAAWIADPQALKPGSRMPGTVLPADSMTALVAYLHSLR